MTKLKSGLELGGSGPKRLLANTTYTGEFFCIKAIGPDDPLLITSIEINGLAVAEWNALSLPVGSEILFTQTPVTKIITTAGSGEGLAYQC